MLLLKGILAVLVSSLAAKAGINTYVFGSLGEAPYQSGSDMVMTTPLPQAGINLEYRTRYLSPYSKASIGRYNHGLVYEGIVGLTAGMKVWVIRPSLDLGTGIQSANDKRYPYFESDVYKTKRKLHFPLVIGARSDVFDLFYAELEGRFRGNPFWKFELGYRFGGWTDFKDKHL